MHAAPSPPGAARHRLALPALTLGVVLVTMNVTIVVVALPSLQRDLDAPPDVAAWVVDAFNLAGASLLLLAGYLADRIGRKRVLVAGYLLFTTGALLCALGLAALVWSGSGIFAAVRQGLSATSHRSRPRPFWRGKLIDFALVPALGLLILLSIGMTAIAQGVIERRLLPNFRAAMK